MGAKQRLEGGGWGLTDRGLADACMSLCSGVWVGWSGVGGHATTHYTHTHTHGEAFHAVTQGLLSFQCFSVIVLSYINPLSCSIDIPCQHSLSLSMQQEDQAGILAFWWSLSHYTHTYSLTKLCMSVQQGLEGKEGDKGLHDSMSPVEAVRSAHISSKLCFGLFFVAV